MNVHVIVTFEVKPERVSAFRALMREVQASLPSVEGCCAVRILQGLDAPAIFTLVETWQSVALHRAHIDKLVSGGQWQVVAEHLIAEPLSRYMQAV